MTFRRPGTKGKEAVPVRKLFQRLVRLTPLPRANESARARDWRDYFTDRTAAIIAEDCAEDIARFGYGFDPPPP